MTGETILIVEDDGILATHLHYMLMELGYNVLAPVASGEEAISVAAARRPDLVLVDIELTGEMNGITAAEQIRAAADIPIIFLTAYSEDKLLQQAKTIAPYGYLVKPVPERELAATIEMALHRHTIDRSLKESKAKLREKTALLSGLLASIPDIVFFKDKKGAYLGCNPEFARFVNRDIPGIVGATDYDLFSKEIADFFREQDRIMMEQGAPRHNEEWIEYPDGVHVLVDTLKAPLRDVEGQVIGILGVSRDITERKRAEKEAIETLQQLQETKDMVIQFEKYAAVGRFAAGVAHEILNPVSIISSRLQFLEEENLEESARENLRVSREQLNRIVKISRDLHQSATKQPGVLVGGDLRRVIEMGLQMTERRIKEDHVQVEYDPPPEVIPVQMERDRVVKVIVNLILNACDAMNGNHIKRLIVTVQYLREAGKNISILLIIADNGSGIPGGNLDRIFEPFFTTKDPGKGTGLGLSVSKGIIQEHGGTIHGANNDMGGASFIVELPLYEP
ncbi:MAG: response regulator [Syntrophus sp. (in: bacteria)]